jgi:hypothetical protein
MFWAVFPSDPCTIIVFVSSLTRRRSSNSDINRVGRCATIVIMMILSVPERAANADAGAHAPLMGAGGKRWRTEHALQSYGAEIEAHRVHLSRTGCGVAGDHLPEHRQQSRIFHEKKTIPNRWRTNTCSPSFSACPCAAQVIMSYQRGILSSNMIQPR